MYNIPNNAFHEQRGGRLAGLEHSNQRFTVASHAITPFRTERLWLGTGISLLSLQTTPDP